MKRSSLPLVIILFFPFTTLLLGPPLMNVQEAYGGLNSFGVIQSYGIINYNTIEYGLQMRGPYYPSYENPIYADPIFQNKLNESGSKWFRTGSLYGIIEQPEVYIPLWSNEIDTIRNLGLKYIIQFGENLQHSTLAEWRLAVKTAMEAFNGRIDAIEIWNEPDLGYTISGYYDGSPEHYFELLQVAYEEIKAVDPNIPVLAGCLGTLSEEGSGPGDYWGGIFIKRIWELGAENYCDAVSIHPYPWWLNRDQLTAAQAIEILYNITGKPIWITEIGISTDWYTEEEQRNWMEQSLNELSHASVKPEIIIWHCFCAGSPYDIVTPDFSEKLTYETFKSFAIS